MRLYHALACLVVLPLPASAADESKWTYVDLQEQGNQKLEDDLGRTEGNHLKNVHKGEQTFEGSKFKVGEKFIHLKGEKEPDLPEKAEGIKVDAKCDKLHILHSTCNGEGNGMQEDGSEIGAYVIHYADK